MEFDPVLVHEWLTATARKLPHKIALVSRGKRLTYRMIEEQSSRLASGLISLGLQRGERAVICLENSPEAIISIYAILKAGGVFVVIDSKSPIPVLNSILSDAEARFLITDNRRPQTKESLKAPQPDFIVIIVDGHKGLTHSHLKTLSWTELIEKAQLPASFPRLLDTDLACLIYTSGSTGNPKGIICTHRNMVAAARSIIQYLENTLDDVILDVLPLSFDYGLYQVIMCFMFGGTVVLEASLGYLEDIMTAIEKEKVTGFPIIPTISAMMLRLKKFPAERLKSLRYITNTGAAWPVSHIRRLRQLLPRVKLYSMYGLSECKRVSYLPPELIDKYPESVGIPIPNLEVAIVDRRGKPVPPGKTGQLVVRGPMVMQGYWRDDELTKKVFRNGRYPEERWLWTGDLFRQDENGLLYFVGRFDRQIKSFGLRVNLAEIERVISSLNEVSEVAAIPFPDELGGEVVGVFVVKKKESRLDEKRLRQLCQQQLEPHKIPRYIWFVDSLPKTDNGKINYRLIISSRSYGEDRKGAGQEESLMKERRSGEGNLKEKSS